MLFLNRWVCVILIHFLNTDHYLHKSRWKQWSSRRNANVSCFWQPISTKRKQSWSTFLQEQTASTRWLTFPGSLAALYLKLMDSNELMLMVWVWAISLAGSQGETVNYWMQKCDPLLMDVEWDNQEANDDRNICQRALYLALDIQNASITSTIPGPFLTHWLPILCSCRAH